MDERQDIQPKDKNIAQLMVKLATVQAQIKLVNASIYMKKQKQAISQKMKDFREYAEGEAEKYAQNMEDASKAIETYQKSVEEAMKQYQDDYLNTMFWQDHWQNMEIKIMGEQKQVSSEIKEKRKTPEYKEWKQAVKNMNREIKAAANDPDKLTTLAEELKELQAKDPTLPEQQKLESMKDNREVIRELIEENEDRLVEIRKDRDDKLNELLENKETSLAKIQKQSIWQKFVARFTSKSKTFKNNVVEPIMDRASKIKNEKIPQIVQDIKDRDKKRKKEIKENIGKMVKLGEKVGDRLVDAKDFAISGVEQGVKAVVEFGREAKKDTITAIRGIGKKVTETRDNVRGTLKTAVEQSAQKLEDLNSGR